MPAVPVKRRSVGEVRCCKHFKIGRKPHTEQVIGDPVSPAKKLGRTGGRLHRLEQRNRLIVLSLAEVAGDSSSSVSISGEYASSSRMRIRTCLGNIRAQSKGQCLPSREHDRIAAQLRNTESAHCVIVSQWRDGRKASLGLGGTEGRFLTLAYCTQCQGYRLGARKSHMPLGMMWASGSGQ
jgi:hypothetical protein